MGHRMFRVAIALLAAAAFLLAAAADGPATNAGQPCGIRFLTQPRLAEGRVGVKYRDVIDVTGGAAPAYFWQLTEGRLPPGVSVTLGRGGQRARVTGTPTVAGRYGFTLVVYEQFDSGLGCSRPREFTITVPEADLRVVQHLSDTTPKVGDILTVDIGVFNGGPFPARDVNLRHFLPPSLPVADAEVVDGPGTCEVATFVRCRFDALAVAGKAIVRIHATAVREGERNSVAGVSSATDDPFTDDNVSSVRLEIAPPDADLGVTLSGPVVRTRNQPFRLVAVVTNHGPDATPSSRLDLIARGALEIAQPRVAGRPCHDDPQVTFVHCAFGPLEPGASVRVVIPARMQQAGPGKLLASVLSLDSDDSNHENDSADHQVIGVP